MIIGIVEELGFGVDGGLNKSQITRLATGLYITKGGSVLITRTTGPVYKKFFIAKKLLMKTKMDDWTGVRSNSKIELQRPDC